MRVEEAGCFHEVAGMSIIDVGSLHSYGTPFVTKLKIAYGHHVSKLRWEKKSEKKEELHSLALALP